MKSLLFVTVGIVLALTLIALGPLATIWALNTLFPVLAIPYNFFTWLAVVIVGTLFSPHVSVLRK